MSCVTGPVGPGEGFLLSPAGGRELRKAVTQEGFILLCELSPHRTELSEGCVVPPCPQFGGQVRGHVLRSPLAQRRHSPGQPWAALSKE